MGPANRKLTQGRGDKNMAAETVLLILCERDLELLKQKYQMLSTNQRLELVKLFDKENFEEFEKIISNSMLAKLELIDYDTD